MKVILAATTIALISLSLTWTNLAAPLQWKVNSDLNNELFKSFISRALIQQEDSHSTEDKEMVATFCKLMIQIMSKYYHFDDELFGDGSKDDYCQDFELPPEPRPEDKSAIRANTYQMIFSILKNSGIDNKLKEYFNLLGRIADG